MALACAIVLVVACAPTAERGEPTAPPTAAGPASAAAQRSATAGPTATAAPGVPAPIALKELPVPAGSGPHDVAPAADGGVWFTAQRSGQLGWLDPKTGQTKMTPLGAGSSPHGVIVGPDGSPWITDSGLNAIVRVDPRTSEVRRLPLPGRTVNLNTAAFDSDGVLWFTGQGGAFGRVDHAGTVQVFEAPRGTGPYGITATPGGDVYYASLAGSYVGRVEKRTGSAAVLEPPTKDAGPRRVWSDSKGVIWVSAWNAGQVARYDPGTGQWKEWKLPGSRPQPYAVFVDDRDIVWLSDFGSSAIVRFDPAAERFDSFPYATGGAVRQLHGRPGEVWGALSAFDKLIVLTTR